MIKLLCDICKNQIEQNTENSVFAFLEYKLSPSHGMQAVQEKEEYCRICTDKIKTIVRKLKQNSAEDVPENKLPDTQESPQ